MPDIKQTTHDLEQVVMEANPWKEFPPVSCSVPYSLLCNVLALLKEQEAMNKCLKKKCVICPHCENCDIDENGLLKEQHQWISVDEQIPSETPYDCLVYQSHGNVTSATFYPLDKLHQWMCGCEWIRNVTHWMPLPKPPKKEGEQE